ncbi:MAG: hypothetical protein L0H73_11445 [Nitrococcus sp.]|nr:hypothetical protein [Nitrococcus sp.]
MSHIVHLLRLVASDAADGRAWVVTAAHADVCTSIVSSRGVLQESGSARTRIGACPLDGRVVMNNVRSRS